MRRAMRGVRGAVPAIALLLVASCASGPPPSLVEQGNAAFEQGAYRDAGALFEKALEGDPRAVEALHGRARVAVALNRPENALRDYGNMARIDEAYVLGPARRDYARALYAAAEARLAKGASGPALEAMRALDRLEPNTKGVPALMARVLTAHAEWLKMHGRRGDAMRHYEEAIDRDPGQAAAYVGAAELLLTDGDRKAALALLTDARRRNLADHRIRALTVQAMGLY